MEVSGNTSEQEIDALAKKIWDYHQLHHQLTKADAILALGSNDIRVAQRAAELFLEGYAPLLIFSGGQGKLTPKTWSEPEANIFAKRARELGVPKENILIENQSTNTGENIILTKKLLKEKNIEINKIILVQKPYMQRRAYATFKIQWPEKELIVSSPQIAYEEYPTKEIPKDYLINIIVGDLQRIKEYPKRGFQIDQDIPKDVWQAYEKLVELGFTKHLIPP